MCCDCDHDCQTQTPSSHPNAERQTPSSHHRYGMGEMWLDQHMGAAWQQNDTLRTIQNGHNYIPMVGFVSRQSSLTLLAVSEPSISNVRVRAVRSPQNPRLEPTDPRQGSLLSRAPRHLRRGHPKRQAAILCRCGSFEHHPATASSSHPEPVSGRGKEGKFESSIPLYDISDIHRL